MRKIVSKSVEKKKQRRNQLIAGGVLVVLMLLSVLGYGFQSSPDDENSEEITYRGLTFINQNGLWYLVTENSQFAFIYNPEQTSQESSISITAKEYTGKPLYYSSENIQAQYEISRNLYLTGIAQRFQQACPEGETCEEDIPTINCENNFIIIREKEDASITQEGNCIYIEGPQERLIELTDEFLFKVFGIK